MCEPDNLSIPYWDFLVLNLENTEELVGNAIVFFQFPIGIF